MNWGKIKTMFIYVFIVLNIILLSFFIYTVEKNSADIVQEKEIIEKSMANDNITVEENYTKKDNLGYVNVTISDLKDIKQDVAGLNYDLTKSDKTAILKVTSEASLTNVNKNNYKVDLDTFLLERFKPSANYIFSSYDSNKKEIIYDQQVDGLRIFSNNNARIIDIAVVNKLVHNKDVLETLIENRTKPELYQYILQAGRTYQGTFDQDNKKYQNINRVFACRNNGINLSKKRLDGGLVKFADAPEKMFLWNDDCSKLENFEKIVDLNHYYQIINKKLTMWEI